jgi:hypothetical protein
LLLRRLLNWVHFNVEFAVERDDSKALNG